MLLFLRLILTYLTLILNYHFDMYCLTPNRVYVRAQHRYIMSPCGHCQACQQAKSDARAARIRYTPAKGQITVFVTLTYSNEYVPYIRTGDLFLNQENNEVPVYRNYDGRYNRLGSDYRFGFVRHRNTSPIGYLYGLHVSASDFYKKNVNSLRHLAKMPSDCVGVCWYKDVQDYQKRLRQILKRHYNYEKSYKYFCCSEYGSRSHRPHFHLLYIIDAGDFELLRSAICEAWPFADTERTKQYIEIAFDAASYVSSYVAGCMDLPTVFQSCVKPKHSYSHDFGIGLSSFSAEAIKEAYERRDYTFVVRRNVGGVPTDVRVPIPRYVLSRYFPKCKGYSRLSIDSLDCIARCPAKILTIPEFEILAYSVKDFVHNMVMLENAYQKFHRLTGINRYDYARLYSTIWSSYSCFLIKYGLEQIEHPLDLLEYYENLSDCFEDKIVEDSPVLNTVKFVSVRNQAFNNLLHDLNIKFSPSLLNHSKSSIRENHRFVERYLKRKKQKYVTNEVMASDGHNV